MAPLFAIDFDAIEQAKQNCISKMIEYQKIHDDYSTFVDECFAKYHTSQPLCSSKEWKSKHETLVAKAKDVNSACNSWTHLIEIANDEVSAMYSQCDDDCDCIDPIHDRLIDYENDAWSYDVYDSNGDGNIDYLNSGDTDFSLCQIYEEPCDYMFSDDESSPFTVISPKNTLTRMENGDVSLEVEVSVNGQPSYVEATFTQQPKGDYRGIIYSAQLQKEGVNWWAQLLLHKDEVYDGPGTVEVRVGLNGEDLSQTIPVVITSKPTKDDSSKPPVVDSGQNDDNSRPPANLNDTKDNSPKDETPCEICSDPRFQGVKSLGSTSEAVQTRDRIASIGKNLGYKVTIVDTPYGPITKVEKPGLSYRDKRRIVETGSSFMGKLLEKVKEKLGLSFGDKLSNYFIKKKLENTLYSDDDKVKKTMDDLGVDAGRAKLFNDVVDTDKRDVYNVVKEELPDNEATKKVKEALVELEKFHDRAAANGLAFEYKTVEDTVKDFVRRIPPDQLESKKDILRNLAVQNIEDYQGSVYRNGNRLLSNGRFIGVLAKKSNKYDLSKPEDRAKYYFDLLWQSGKIREWNSGVKE